MFLIVLVIVVIILAAPMLRLRCPEPSGQPIH
jgi:hypothetical protein